MLTFYNGEGFRQEELNRGCRLTLSEAIWVDLLNPTGQELETLKECFGFKVPTRAEMVEIELSSRLYVADGNLFMTGSTVSNSDSVSPILDPVTFILTKKQLITIRYIEPQAFKIFISQVNKNNVAYTDPLLLLIDLLDVTIDRVADILEYIDAGVDSYSKQIFKEEGLDTGNNYKVLLQKIAASSDLNSKAQESLVSFNRLVPFLLQSAGSRIDKNNKARLTSLRKDILSLNHHSQLISNKVSFVLDATLGLVNIDQNRTIKSLSVGAAIFLPPTLIASIYGMNFEFIPALTWKYGYVFAIGLIAVAAWVPYKYFKRKKWL